MYRRIKTLKGSLTIADTELYLAQRLGKTFDLIQVTPSGERANAFVMDLTNVYHWTVTHDFLIVSLEDGVTTFYNLPDKKKLFSIDKKICLTWTPEDDLYIYMIDEGFYFRLNKNNNKIESFIISNENPRTLIFFYLFNNNLIFRQRVERERFLLSYKNQLDEVELSWKFGLKSFYQDKEDNQIKYIKSYQDSLLVITDAGVLRLSASDGSVIWKTDGYARTLEIVGNMGYVCTGGSLFKINLDTGEESGYGWDCDGLPRFTYKGITFRASGHEVVYHDGLLWYSVYSSGHSFLIAINVDNGNYEWVHHVDTNEKTRAPQFYGDKMFLSDSGGLLHIYEKEK